MASFISTINNRRVLKQIQITLEAIEGSLVDNGRYLRQVREGVQRQIGTAEIDLEKEVD